MEGAGLMIAPVMVVDDEAIVASCASVIDACIESGLPLSYVGTGRDIPGDLDPAEPRSLIRRTLQGAHTS